MVDNTTGRSRGFGKLKVDSCGHAKSTKLVITPFLSFRHFAGFVSFDDRETAMSAIHSMDGFQIGHKRLKVSPIHFPTNHGINLVFRGTQLVSKPTTTAVTVLCHIGSIQNYCKDPLEGWWVAW